MKIQENPHFITSREYLEYEGFKQYQNNLSFLKRKNSPQTAFKKPKTEREREMERIEKECLFSKH